MEKHGNLCDLNINREGIFFCHIKSPDKLLKNCANIFLAISHLEKKLKKLRMTSTTEWTSSDQSITVARTGKSPTNPLKIILHFSTSRRTVIDFAPPWLNHNSTVVNDSQSQVIDRNCSFRIFIYVGRVEEISSFIIHRECTSYSLVRQTMTAVERRSSRRKTSRPLKRVWNICDAHRRTSSNTSRATSTTSTAHRATGSAWKNICKSTRVGVKWISCIT